MIKFSKLFLTVFFSFFIFQKMIVSSTILGVLGRLFSQRDKWEFIPFLYGTPAECNKVLNKLDSLGLTTGAVGTKNVTLWYVQIDEKSKISPGDVQSLSSQDRMYYRGQIIHPEDHVPCLFSGNSIPSSWKEVIKHLERRLVFISAQDVLTALDLITDRQQTINQYNLLYELYFDQDMVGNTDLKIFVRSSVWKDILLQ